MVYYSATLNGFIPAEWRFDGTYNINTWPGDAVLLSDKESDKYWKVTPAGGKVLGSVSGRPAWVDIPPITIDELIYCAVQNKRVRKEVADSEIDWRQDAVDAEEASKKEISELAAWKKYRVALMRIDISKAPDINWPESPNVA
ncbi:tail assembly chaperone gp38 [Yersinia pseudotuberculosis]|uniref:Tail assembly chaperone gp38 n=1 Tax=Yersinia pseudotuberculosis serotype O:3 (strain YPIII) TaxID=502800 RepID=A0A0H3B283_YERPY|nr:tail fiber assembly protein [Yersinia pseudotuberculosis]AJJ61014.1 caudovirales tail fiber assembly family protein [Yersinia pseudotuberculosis YPIII]AYW86975.1 phage tail protein [Yersinia pseudotuberculosis]MBK1425955.1 tail fiber assembly protein [Yersinia pseudotuberculosis]SQA61796.1 tail assembly chaperone gp38 [Yersinia pseudotuberculosis]